MNLSSKELKRQARETLNNRYGLPMLAFLLTQVIVMAISLPFDFMLPTNPNTSQLLIYTLTTFIISLLSIVLSCGLIKIHLHMARKEETKLGDLFYFFSHRPDRFLLAGLLMIGIVFLLMLPAFALTIFSIFSHSDILLMVMAVVWIITIVILIPVSFSFSLIYYILIEKPEDSLIEIFKESRQLMKGNKWRLFYVNLSFMGMNILSLLSFGLGLLWVGPYMNQTLVEFYRNVIGEI